jgi:hypothetical protein
VEALIAGVVVAAVSLAVAVRIDADVVLLPAAGFLVTFWVALAGPVRPRRSRRRR